MKIWQLALAVFVIVALVVLIEHLFLSTPTIDGDVAKTFPEYTTRVTYTLESTRVTYYVKPNSGWEVQSGTLTLNDYISFGQRSSGKHTQGLVLSSGTGWWMKSDAREEVRGLIGE